MIRWCYTCKHRKLCYIRRKMDDLILNSIGYMEDNKPTKKTPKFWQDLFKTLADVCLEYEYKPEE